MFNSHSSNEEKGNPATWGGEDVIWFPITCLYRWEGKITEEPEVVLLVKTKKEFFKKIEKIITSKIDYTNCIAEIPVSNQRKEFLEWLEKETTL